jgi:hypothetical protein
MRKVLTGVAVPLIAAMGIWLGSANGTAIARPSAPIAVRATNESTSQPDTDSVQQGDKTSPDISSARGVRASEAGSTETDNGGEGSGQNSDGPGGHQDPAGDVNHECAGDCQE